MKGHEGQKNLKTQRTQRTAAEDAENILQLDGCKGTQKRFFTTKETRGTKEFLNCKEPNGSRRASEIL
jgi:hypothetical protein